MHLALTIDYEIEDVEDDEVEEIVSEIVKESTRQFAAQLSNNLEARGVKDIRIDVQGD